MIEGRFHGTRARLSFSATTEGLVPKVWCVLSFIVIPLVCLHRHVCELFSVRIRCLLCVCPCTHTPSANWQREADTWGCFEVVSLAGESPWHVNIMRAPKHPRSLLFLIKIHILISHLMQDKMCATCLVPFITHLLSRITPLPLPTPPYCNGYQVAV